MKPVRDQGTRDGLSLLDNDAEDEDEDEDEEDEDENRMSGVAWASGITFVHPLSTGVLDGEASDWGAHMCTAEDALSLAERSPDGSLVCRVKIAVFGSTRESQEKEIGGDVAGATG